MVFVVLGIGCVLGFVVLRLGLAADWGWTRSILAALLPVAFTLFLGLVGVLISAALVGAIYKASA